MVIQKISSKQPVIKETKLNYPERFFAKDIGIFQLFLNMRNIGTVTLIINIWASLVWHLTIYNPCNNDPVEVFVALIVISLQKSGVKISNASNHNEIIAVLESVHKLVAKGHYTQTQTKHIEAVLDFLQQ